MTLGVTTCTGGEENNAVRACRTELQNVHTYSFVYFLALIR